ncbi:MAG: hypothetical protein KAS71_13950 [Bacteroidales bacterium]|nr:hypothetical protein [Bacteroidales bacterium]
MVECARERGGLIKSRRSTVHLYQFIFCETLFIFRFGSRNDAHYLRPIFAHKKANVARITTGGGESINCWYHNTYEGVEKEKPPFLGMMLVYSVELAGVI